jgi:phosphoribosylamine--glycine ligase
MKVLVIGSGGREHAICWRLRQSKIVTHVFCAPGNPGIEMSAKLVDIKVDDISALISFVKENGIELTVVGPEYPLSLGIVDAFRLENLRIFGASKEASQLESSKAFAKKIMNDAGVPTGHFKVVQSKKEASDYIAQCGAPIVLKADGLASGKGVFVCKTIDEAQEAVASLYKNSDSGSVVIEEFLEGIEVSYIIATDGENIIPMQASHDYKRIFDHDAGPNTGGMGSVCPTPRFNDEQEDFVLHHVMVPVLAQMKRRGTPFSGFLYAGLMIAPNGTMKVLEFNTRLGDPETQSIMRQFDSDLLETLYELSDPSSNVVIQNIPAPTWAEKVTVSIVLAAEGYPDAPKTGDEITGIHLAESLPDVVVFHAGTKFENGKLVTTGGRVLVVSAQANSLESARAQAYKASDMIQFRGRQMRRDIGIN